MKKDMNETGDVTIPALERLVGTYTPKNRRWSKHDLDTIIKYWPLNVPPDAIAKELKRTVKAVIDKADDLKLRRGIDE